MIDGLMNIQGRNARLAGRIAVTAKLALILIVSAGAARGESPLEREIRSALAGVPHAETVSGICVIDLSSGETVFSLGADTPLVPASNMKVFVMAAALSLLGPQFAFETTFATDGSNVFLIGDGDPALGDERLCQERGESITAVFERWADVLINAGVRLIPGDILIDESIFDDQRTNPTWDQADLDNWYAAPVGGLNINDNCVDITIHPGDHLGDLVRVSVQPDSTLVKIINTCKTVAGKSTPILHHRYDTFEYAINKRCSKEWRFGPVTFPDPGLLAGDSLRNVLIQKGISVAGGLRLRRMRRPDGSLPPSLTIIATHHTTIADVLRRAGKNSQNLFAECLLKRSGIEWARRRGMSDPRGSWELGRDAVLATLQDAGIDTANLTVADGSGLSRENRCTPRQLAQVLAWMQTQPAARLFLESLSIAGVDGSLRKHLKEVPNRVFGKTGTMRAVRTLSGYVDPASGGGFAFAVMFNGYKGSSTPYREIQDRICRALINSGTSRTITE